MRSWSGRVLDGAKVMGNTLLILAMTYSSAAAVFVDHATAFKGELTALSMAGLGVVTLLLSWVYRQKRDHAGIARGRCPDCNTELQQSELDVNGLQYTFYECVECDWHYPR